MQDTSGNPRVGIVTGSLSSAAGGVFFVISDVANRLQARGMSHTLFGLRDSSLDEDRARWRVGALHAFGSFGPPTFRVSFSMLREMRRTPLDVLHVHGIWNFASLAALLWRRSTRLPVVISPHGMLDPGALTFSLWKKRIVAWLYERANLRGATAIHALNDAEVRAIRAFGVNAPVATIPNGVDLPPNEVLEARDWFDKSRRTMLFLARIHPKKGVQELISAWRMMLDRAPQHGRRWQLVLAGWDDGGLMERAREQIAALDLIEHVSMPGSLFGDAKHAAFASAHAFILPSRSEGLPVAVLEAWAYGLPVLMTEACNLSVGFTEDAALRIESDAAPLADGLVRYLAATDARLQAIGANGRALVERDFTWNRAVSDYATLYRWLTEGGDAPSFVQFAMDTA